MVKLYHYTSRKNLEPILSSYKIKAYKPHFGRSTNPYGVYLTELDPSSGPWSLATNNYAAGGMLWLDDYEQMAAKTVVSFEFDHWRLHGVYRNWQAGVCNGKPRNEWIYGHSIDLGLCNRVLYDNAWHLV